MTPEMIFSPEALQAIRETVIQVMRSDEGQAIIRDAQPDKPKRVGRRVL